MAIGIKVTGKEMALKVFHLWQDPTSLKEEKNLQECGRVSGHRLEDRTPVPNRMRNNRQGD